MAQPLVELKEPLISMETKNKLQDTFLRSYRGIYSQKQEDENNEQNEYQASNADQQEEKDIPKAAEPQTQGYQHKLEDYNTINQTVLDQPFVSEPHLKKFYNQATAAHELPGLTIQEICYQKSNPNIFAVISRASDMFKEVDVHEFMGFDDYKKLTKIRIRNYVNILRMLTKVDTSPEVYEEIKVKLFQVKKLTEYLSITGFERIFKRLAKNLQIHDLEDIPEDAEEKAPEEEKHDEEEKKSEKSQKSQQDEGEPAEEEPEEKSEKDNEEGNEEEQEKSEKEDEEKSQSEKESEEKDGSEEDDNEYGEESEEEQEPENEEDQEYADFFKLSELSNGHRGYFTLELEKEELKWVKRAEWLEAAIEKLKAKEETKGWVPWFNAKLDQLADLDVPIKSTTDNSSNQVFYFFKFIDETITKYNPEQDYHKDQKVYPEEQNQYPKIKIDVNYSLNEAGATLKSWTTLREKLCRRVKRREQDTDYFLTVFEKKAFGNEKIYEKRLNIRNKTFYQVTKFEMHPQGGYIYLQFDLYMADVVTFRVVFPLNAPFKDPLLIKKDSDFHCFQDKFLYTTVSVTERKVKEKQKPEGQTDKGDDDMKMVIEGETDKGPDEDKAGEAQPGAEAEEHHEESDEDVEEETYTRCYEYDLIDFNKVKFVDFKNQGPGDIYKEDGQEEFVRYKDGFFFLRRKHLDPEEKFQNYEIQFKNDLLKMDSSEKFEAANIEKVAINDKNDRLLIVHWKDGMLLFNRYSIDFREKKIKKVEDIKLKQEMVTFDQTTKNVAIKIIPIFNDFMLLFKPSKGKKVFIFQNENPITSYETEIDNLSFNYTTEKPISSIINADPYNFKSNAEKNLIRYQICKFQGEKDKKEWSWTVVNHEIYNRQDEVCFPYAYTIYNQDQVFMKDLTQKDLQGYYYMNSFMGIDQGQRPLTIHSVTYNNKLNLSIPVINSNYTGQDFLIKVHQIKSCYEQNTMFRFKGLVRHRVYSYNQDILSILAGWTGVSDSKNRLHYDIRISSKYHSMNIEQWEKGICIQRLIVTHFHLTRDETSRDVTDKNTTLDYKPRGCWFIVTQRQEGQSSIIEVFTREMRYSFKIPELLALKSIWDYSDDDSTSPIYGLYVDTLVKDKIDLYVLYANCQMRKFSSPITSENLQFEEHTHIYNLESLFKGLEKEGGEGGSKKVNLYEQYKGDVFVANKIFYSQKVIIDLSAANMVDKFQLGNPITFSILKDQSLITKFTYSHNEARLAAFYKSSDLGHSWRENYPSCSRNGYTLILTPVWNSRQIPQFQHRAFRHPVVPIVDKEKGCVTVFTLQLGTLYTEPYYTTFGTHSALNKRMWSKWLNLNPGLYIKYFNGVEELVPLHLFQEEFSELIRFQQSTDGKYILIVGTRQGKLEDRFYDQQLIEGLHEQKGMFLYKLSINSIVLVKAFLFAQKNPITLQQNVAWALSLPPQKYREEIPPEVPGTQIYEYTKDYMDDDGKHDYVSYQDRIEFKQTDEFYVDELKRLKEEETRRLAAEEELLNRKNANSKSLNNRSVNKRSTLLNSIGADEDHEEKQSNAGNPEEGEKPAEEEFANIARLDDLKLLFPGFDIPYLAKKSYQQTSLEQSQRDAKFFREIDGPPVLIPEGVEQYKYNYEKEDAQMFTDEQVEKIKSIHEQMHLELNEQGHIFLINRLCNKIYFFYECNGEHKVASFKFEHDFVIDRADSTQKYLVVTGIEKKDDKETHKYKIFNIEQMINSQEHDRRFTLAELPIVYDSAVQESMGVKKENVGPDEYTYSIQDCKVVGEKIIIKVIDSQEVKYLKVVDMKKRILNYYIEGDRFLLSGDKQFIWKMETNEVYDIINGLSTYFLWPGDQINTHAYDHMDVFNINEDRTIMVTQGYLQLAFNLFSMKIDDELQSCDFKQPTAFFTQCYNLTYLCYKISHYKSILEKVFYEDYDKLTKNKFQDDSNEPDDIEVVKKIDLKTMNSMQQKQLQNLMGHLQAYEYLESWTPAFKSNFFLSAYYIDKQQQKGGSEKEPYQMNIFEKLFTKNANKDIIEDALSYVVNCTTVPITQSVINTCFTDFLQNANVSQSFQFYLNNITSQTTNMSNVEKFQMASSEQGFLVESFSSPIMDDRFYTKFKQIKETKIDVEMSYINLGTLLTDHGAEIMEMLSDKKYLSIMDIPFIRYLVMYQWINIKYTIHKKLLIPFMILLFLFTSYSITIDFTTYEEGAELPDPGAMYIVNWVNSILLVGILAYFFKVEVSQFIQDPQDYFKDFWNMSDLISYFMCLVVIIFDRTPVPASINRPIASLCLIVLWIKMFYFLRVFESTSKLIRMIIEIVNDMKNFLIVLFIGIIGFTGGFFILQQAVPSDSEAPLPGTYIMSMIYTYRLASGDFQLDFLDELSGADYILGWFLFVFGSLFLVIVLLNLLIAIMGDTFSRVLESITNLTVREKVMLVSENEALFNRNQLFQQSQFLIVITEKNLDSVQAENWDGQINALKRQVLDKVTSMETKLDTKITENQKDLKKKIMDQEERAKKQGVMQEQRMQSTVKSEFVDAFVKISEQFTNQQTAMKSQQNLAMEQMRTMRMLQEQLEHLRNEQGKLTQIVHKAIGSNPNANNDDEE